MRLYKKKRLDTKTHRKKVCTQKNTGKKNCTKKRAHNFDSCFPISIGIYDMTSLMINNINMRLLILLFLIKFLICTKKLLATQKNHFPHKKTTLVAFLWKSSIFVREGNLCGKVVFLCIVGFLCGKNVFLCAGNGFFVWKTFFCVDMDFLCGQGFFMGKKERKFVWKGIFCAQKRETICVEKLYFCTGGKFVWKRSIFVYCMIFVWKKRFFVRENVFFATSFFLCGEEFFCAYQKLDKEQQ